MCANHLFFLKKGKKKGREQGEVKGKEGQKE